MTLDQFEAAVKHAAIATYRAKRSAANKSMQVTLCDPRDTKLAEAFGTAE